MGFPDYREDLVDADVDVNHILDRYFHSGLSAVFAGAGPEEEPALIREVARELFSAFGIRIHPFQLVISGSAHLGFSPVPGKLGKPFDPATSDIDFSVISPELFDAWWTQLQSVALDAATREAVSRDLFWGFINPANVQYVPGIGATWWQTFGAFKTDRAHGIRGRLYRNFWSMQSYHRLAIVRGRRDLQQAAPAEAQAGD